MHHTHHVAWMVGAGLIGAAIGFAVWMITDAFVFLPVFLAAGLSVAIAFDEPGQQGR